MKKYSTHWAEIITFLMTKKNPKFRVNSKYVSEHFVSENHSCVHRQTMLCHFLARYCCFGKEWELMVGHLLKPLFASSFYHSMYQHKAYNHKSRDRKNFITSLKFVFILCFQKVILRLCNTQIVFVCGQILVARLWEWELMFGPSLKPLLSIALHHHYCDHYH